MELDRGPKHLEWLLAIPAIFLLCVTAYYWLSEPENYEKEQIEQAEVRIFSKSSSGRRGDKYLAKTFEGGKLIHLSTNLLLGSSGRDFKKGDVVKVKYIKGRLLSCEFQGVQKCTPECSSPAECQAVSASRHEKMRISMSWVFVAGTACCAALGVGMHRANRPA